MKFQCNHINKTGVIIRTRKVKQRETTPKLLMSELWILCMTVLLLLLNLYTCMKFHCNSISKTEVIFLTKKMMKGKN